MNKSLIVLLAVADKRPVAEAREWFDDGWRLLKMRMAQWTSFSAVGILTLFFASVAGEMPVLIGGEALSSAAVVLKLLLVNVAIVMVQSGMFRAMTRVAHEDGKVQMADLWWLLSAPQKKHLLAFAGMLVALNALFLWLEQRVLAGEMLMVPNPNGEFLMGQMRVDVNMPLLWLYVKMWTGYSLLVWAITWAVLPMMTMFADVSLTQALRLAWAGMWKNLPGLLVLAVLILVASMVAGMLIVVLSAAWPALMLPLAAVCAVWMFPLSNMWAYAAFRHIYTDW